MRRKSRKSNEARSGAPPGGKAWWIFSGAVAVLVIAIGAGVWSGQKPLADPGNAALGGKVYAQYCASCHGGRRCGNYLSAHGILQT